ncbi:MAG: hypothetical protein OEM52_12185 [bacterium]|nr:hypothetical protein [bacterium]
MKTTIWENLSKLDKRWIFLCMLFAVTLPLLFPINLPLSASEPVMSFYKTVEAIPEGSLVLVSNDYDPGSKAELYPMTEAVFYHLFKKKCRIVILSLYPAGPPMSERAIEQMRTLFPNIKDQVDYINLGYKDGREAVIVEMGRSLKGAFPRDYRGRAVTDAPIMAEVENYKNFKAVVSISVGYPGTKEYVQYAQGRFNLTLLAGAAAVSVPEYSAYYNAGQLKGMLTGITGAGEYEELVDRRALAAKATDAQAFGHTFIILLIIVGNVAWFTSKRKGGKHV